MIEKASIADTDGSTPTDAQCKDQQNPTLQKSASFRRSQRLQSLLSKMRDTRKEECHLVESSHKMKSKVYASSAVNEEQKESNQIFRKDVSSNEADTASTTLKESVKEENSSPTDARPDANEGHEGHQEGSQRVRQDVSSCKTGTATTTLQEGVKEEVASPSDRNDNQNTNESGTESREDVSEDQREEDIREQIHVAVRDSILDSSNANEREKSFTFSGEAIQKRNSRPDGPQRKAEKSPEKRREKNSNKIANKSPQKTLQKTPRKNPQKGQEEVSTHTPKDTRPSNPAAESRSSSPRKTATIARSAKRASTRASPQLQPSNKYSLESSSDDVSTAENDVTAKRLISDLSKRIPNEANPRENQKGKQSSFKAQSVSSEDLEERSSDSSANNNTYSWDSSTEGYSTASSKKKRSGSSKKKRSKTIGTGRMPLPAALSPMALQAGEIITKFVDQLKLHQAFGLPDKIKQYAQSQPLAAADDSSDESATDDTNSIVKNDSKIIPKRDVMKELRETLARRRAGRRAAMEAEGAKSAKKYNQNKLTPEIPAETETTNEAIPQMVLTDSASTRSHPNKDQDWKVGPCGPLTSCFVGSELPIPKPSTIDWHSGGFLSSKEAMAVLDKVNEWDGHSTTPLCVWPIPKPEELAACHSHETSRSTNCHSTKKLQASEELVTAITEGVEGTDQLIDKNDDALSLAYSSGSDDDSMVALRHGERELTKPSRPNPLTQETPTKLQSPGSMNTSPEPSRPVAPSPESFSQLRRVSPAERCPISKPSHADLTIALSLSQDSNDVIATPHDATILSSDTSSANHEKLTAIPRPLNDQAYQEELQSKIEESQRRRQIKEKIGGLSFNNIYSPQSVVHRSKGDLPIATRKIAQAYVDALSKKHEPTPINADFPSSISKNFESIKLNDTDLSDELIPSPGMWKSRAAICSSEPSSRLSTSILCHVDDNSAGKSAPPSQGLGFGNVDDLVLRIDNVVQALVKAGKINRPSVLSSGAVEGNNIIRNDTEELLNNLALLRARRERGSSRSSNDTPSTTTLATRLPVPAPGIQLPNNCAIRPELPEPRQTWLPAPWNPPEVTTNLQILRAKRNQAAMAVRMSAERLAGWSTDTSERVVKMEDTKLEKNSNPTIENRPTGRRFGSAKLNGPPKPEQYSRRLRTIESHHVIRHEEHVAKVARDPRQGQSVLLPSAPLAMPAVRKVDANSTPTTERLPSRQAPSQIVAREFTTSGPEGTQWLEPKPTRDTDTQITNQIRHGSPSLPELAPWADEQLDELAVLLQATFSGNQLTPTLQSDDATNTSENDEFDGNETEGTNGSCCTEESSTCEDEATDYGSDDDTERLDRIEKMIRELRARRMRL